MEGALTNSADINADTVRLWNGAKRRHEEVRDILVPKVAVVDPQKVQLFIQDEVDTVLQYQNVQEGQVPNLAGLLEYLKQIGGAGSTVNRYTTTYNHNFLTQQSDLHVYQRNLQNVKKQYRTSVEIYAPVLYQKRVQNLKVVRPVYIFAP